MICHFHLDKTQIETQWHIKFDEYFAAELEELEGMVNDGLLTIEEDSIQVQDRGRLLIRNICMVFDHYLGGEGQTTRFSKVI